MQRRELIAFLAAVLGDAAIRLGVARAQGQASPTAAADHQVGEVATLQGRATVTRGNGAPAALKVNAAIFKNDALDTGDNSSLGITFDDETTFNLSANAHIAINEFVYQERGKKNAAEFNIARGTVAFVASKVAKTGNMTVHEARRRRSAFTVPPGWSRGRPAPRAVSPRSNFIRTPMGTSGGSRCTTGRATCSAR